jgi:hypothetical protein
LLWRYSAAFCFGQSTEELKNACEKEGFASCFELGNIYMHQKRDFVAAEEY